MNLMSMGKDIDNILVIFDKDLNPTWNWICRTFCIDGEFSFNELAVALSNKIPEVKIYPKQEYLNNIDRT